MHSVAVFCGANLGNRPVFAEQARALGRTLAERRIRVVFGGGSVGLMGIVADAVLEAGGPITGIITHQLNSWEVGHGGVQDMVVVESMAERRTLLLKGTDGVITMPGGYGSMDELFEALTLAQLQQYPKPIGLLNVEGYYDPLLVMLDRMVENGFLKPANRQLCIEGREVPELLDKMADFEHHPVLKWM
jgi:uncharacterized protein (TIGR00730 family)